MDILDIMCQTSTKAKIGILFKNYHDNFVFVYRCHGQSLSIIITKGPPIKYVCFRGWVGVPPKACFAVQGRGVVAAIAYVRFSKKLITNILIIKE